MHLTRARARTHTHTHALRRYRRLPRRGSAGAPPYMYIIYTLYAYCYYNTLYLYYTVPAPSRETLVVCHTHMHVTCERDYTQSRTHDARTQSRTHARTHARERARARQEEGGAWWRSGFRAAGEGGGRDACLSRGFVGGFPVSSSVGVCVDGACAVYDESLRAPSLWGLTGARARG